MGVLLTLNTLRISYLPVLTPTFNNDALLLLHTDSIKTCIKAVTQKARLFDTLYIYIYIYIYIYQLSQRSVDPTSEKPILWFTDYSPPPLAEGINSWCLKHLRDLINTNHTPALH